MQLEEPIQSAKKSNAASQSRTHKSSRAGKSVPSASSFNEKLLQLHPTALLCQKTYVVGSHPIRVGANAIIQPFARIDSTAGPVEIGDGCIIWECANVGYSKHYSNGVVSDAAGQQLGVVTTTVGKNSVVDSQSTIEAGAELMHGCTIGVGARVGMRARLGEVSSMNSLS